MDDIILKDSNVSRRANNIVNAIRNGDDLAEHGLSRTAIDGMLYPFGLRLLRFENPDQGEEFWRDTYWKYNRNTRDFDLAVKRMKGHIPTDRHGAGKDMKFHGTTYVITDHYKSQWFKTGIVPNRIQAIRIAFMLKYDTDKANEYLKQVCLTVPLNLNKPEEFIFSFGLNRKYEFAKCLNIIKEYESRTEYAELTGASSKRMVDHYTNAIEKLTNEEELISWMVKNSGEFKGYSKSLNDKFSFLMSRILRKCEELQNNELQIRYVDYGNNNDDDERDKYLNKRYSIFRYFYGNVLYGTIPTIQDNIVGGGITTKKNLPDMPEEFYFDYEALMYKLYNNVEVRLQLNFLKRMGKTLSTGRFTNTKDIVGEIIHSLSWLSQKNQVETVKKLREMGEISEQVEYATKENRAPVNMYQFYVDTLFAILEAKSPEQANNIVQEAIRRQTDKYAREIDRDDLLLLSFVNWRFDYMSGNNLRVYQDNPEAIYQKFETTTNSTLTDCGCEPITHRSRLDVAIQSCVRNDEIKPFSEIAYLYDVDEDRPAVQHVYERG